MRGDVQSHCELGDLPQDLRGMGGMKEFLVPLLRSLAWTAGCIRQQLQAEGLQLDRATI